MPWDAVDHEGQWVEVQDDVVRVIQEIERLWPELKVQYAENPDLGQAPFRVVETTKAGQEVEVLRVWELDNRLLDLLHDADSHKHGLQIVKKIEKNDASVRADAQRVWKGWKELCADIIVHMANHPGGTYTFKDPREEHEGEVVKVTDS